MDIEKLRFPVREFFTNKNPDQKLFKAWIGNIENFTSQVEQLTRNISTEKLNWKYRPNGWTVKQVIHHCADSHMNGLIRLKLTLTEDKPTIRPYFEARWAELGDSLEDDIQDSLS